MLVHRMGARKESFESICAESDCDRQADGTPNREAASDPVPNGKKVFFRQSELFRSIRFGGDHYDVMLEIFFRDTGFLQPIQNLLRIGSCFLSLKALGRDDNQGRKRIQDGSDSVKNHAVGRS